MITAPKKFEIFNTQIQDKCKLLQTSIFFHFASIEKNQSKAVMQHSSSCILCISLSEYMDWTNDAFEIFGFSIYIIYRQNSWNVIFFTSIVHRAENTHDLFVYWSFFFLCFWINQVHVCWLHPKNSFRPYFCAINGQQQQQQQKSVWIGIFGFWHLSVCINAIHKNTEYWSENDRVQQITLYMTVAAYIRTYECIKYLCVLKSMCRNPICTNQMIWTGFLVPGIRIPRRIHLLVNQWLESCV